MEIERKFLVKALPEGLADYPHARYEQGYLSTSPVVRVRQEGDNYVLTYKGKGFMIREEYNLPLTRESYLHLLQKADGLILTKNRYRLPISFAGLSLTLELDEFLGPYTGLYLAEIEFPDEDTALSYQPEPWLGEEVTRDPRFHNSHMSIAFDSSVLPEKPL